MDCIVILPSYIRKTDSFQELCMLKVHPKLPSRTNYIHVITTHWLFNVQGSHMSPAEALYKSVTVIKLKNEGVFVKHYAPGGNKVQ